MKMNVLYSLSVEFLLVAAFNSAASFTHKLACAFGNGNTSSCLTLNLLCNSTTTIDIHNAICGIHDGVDYSCDHNLQKDCINESQCCLRQSSEARHKMPKQYKDRLSNMCSQQRECHYLAPVQTKDFQKVHYCYVLYSCSKDEPVTAQTSTSIYANNPGVSVSTKTSISTFANGSDEPVTIKTSLSTHIPEEQNSEELSIPLATIIIPIALLLLCIGFGIFLFKKFWKKKRRQSACKNINIRENSCHRSSFEASNQFVSPASLNKANYNNDKETNNGLEVTITNSQGGTRNETCLSFTIDRHNFYHILEPQIPNNRGSSENIFHQSANDRVKADELYNESNFDSSQCFTETEPKELHTETDNGGNYSQLMSNRRCSMGKYLTDKCSHNSNGYGNIEDAIVTLPEREYDKIYFTQRKVLIGHPDYDGLNRMDLQSKSDQERTYRNLIVNNDF